MTEGLIIDGQRVNASDGQTFDVYDPSSGDVLASVAILAIVCTAAAFLAFAALIDEVGPVRATVITYVNPAVAAVLGVLVLHETLSVAMWFGFALVILGSTLATRPSGAVQGPGPTRVEAAFRTASK